MEQPTQQNNNQMAGAPEQTGANVFYYNNVLLVVLAPFAQH
jgi:hypothetical protein